jgi:hypothetical protein
MESISMSAKEFDDPRLSMPVTCPDIEKAPDKLSDFFFWRLESTIC